MFKWERHNLKEKWTKLQYEIQKGKHNTPIAIGLIAISIIATIGVVCMFEYIRDIV